MGQTSKLKFARLALVLCLSAGGAALPAQESPDKLAEILSQQLDLKTRLDAGELPLTPRQANAIRASQAEVFNVTQGASRLVDLDLSRRVRLENALERINALVAGTAAAASRQQVCKRVPVTGSSVKTTRCATQDEWDRVRENSRDTLERRHVCEPPGCGSSP